jgi:hypothetical protein
MTCCATQEGKDNGSRLLKYSAIGLVVGIVIRVIIEVMAVGTRR